MRIPLVLVCLLMATSCVAAEAPAPDFDIAGADTVRTNLWIVQALMTDMAREVVAAVPQSGCSVSLTPLGKHDAMPLLASVLFDALESAGCEAYLEEPPPKDPKDAEDAPPPLDTDYQIRYRIEAVDLDYPRSGRKLGIWTNWVDRQIWLSIMATVIERHSGRLLMDDRLCRSYDDRMSADALSVIDDPVYEFTTAQKKGGGLMSVLEEVVVVGALGGLVAVYFANTSN